MSARSANKALEVSGIRKSFGQRDVFRDVSFSVDPGEIIAIIGPNGSGKTTLIKSILGLITKDKGEVLVYGKPLSVSLNQIGYLPQSLQFDRSLPITVREFLELSLINKKNSQAVEEKLMEVDMRDKSEAMLGTLSGGQLQRVMIARAILNDPKILFLDEPVTGIDIEAEKNFYQLIEHLNKKHGMTVIFISHELELVYDFASQVVCLNKSLVCNGVPRKVLTPELLEKGKTVYTVNCMTCHGEKGDGNGPAGQYMNPKPRDFAKEKFKGGKSGSGK